MADWGGSSNGSGPDRSDASQSGGSRGNDHGNNGDRGSDNQNQNQAQPEDRGFGKSEPQNTPAPSAEKSGGDDYNPRQSAEGVIGRALGLNRTRAEIQADIAGYGAGPWDQSNTYYNPPDVGAAWSEIAHNGVDALGSFVSGLGFAGPVGGLGALAYELTDIDENVNEFVSQETPTELQEIKGKVEGVKSDLESEVEKAIGPEATKGVKTAASYAGFGSLGFMMAGAPGLLIGLGVRLLAGPDPREKDK